MGRKQTYYDEQFGRQDHDPSDDGTFVKNLVFVGMSFSGKEMDDTYKAIKDECSKLKLKAARVDENVGSGFIIREITQLIEDAEFIIFDLTKERPNVYYEIGYAHGVGNEAYDILLVAKKETVIHFDISPMKINFYESTEDLREIVRSNLNAMIRKTRG